MPMKVQTKLDLGHDFDTNLNIRIDDVTASHKASSCPKKNIDAREETLRQYVRTLVLDAYSMGVSQGVAKEKLFNMYNHDLHPALITQLAKPLLNREGDSNAKETTS